MRRAWKWFKRILGFTFALALLAVAAVLILVHTDWGRNKVREQVVSILLDQFPGGVKIGSLDGSIFGTLELHDIELDGVDHKPLITAKKLKLRPKLLPLLWKTVRVENISMSDVAIDWRDQPAKPASPSTEPKVASPWSIDLQRIVIHRGHFSLAGKPVTLDGLEFGGSFAIPSGKGIELTASLHGTWTERNAPIAATASFALVDGLPIIPTGAITVGGVTVTATDVNGESGTVVVRGTADAIAALEPSLKLPGDVLLEVSADAQHKVDIRGAIGPTPIEGSVQLDKAPFGARGTIGTHDVDLGQLTNEKLHGLAGAVLTFVTDGKSFHGTVVALPRVADIPVDTAVINFSGTPAGGHVLAFVDGPGGLNAIVEAAVTREKVTSSHAFISLQDASYFVPQARGGLKSNLTAAGPFATLAFTGTANARAVRYDTFGLAEMRASFSGRMAKPRPYGSAHVELRGLLDGALGNAVIDAKDDTSGRIAVTVHAEPKPDVQADLDATIVQRGSELAVTLGNHRVNTPTALLSGIGGKVVVGKEKIVLSDFRTSAGQGGIDLAATYTKSTGTLAATAKLQQVELDELVPAVMGHLDGTVSLGKRGTWWSAKADLTGTGMHGMDTLSAETELHLALDGRKLSVGAKAINKEVGGAEVFLELIGPVSPFDVHGWEQLPRADVLRLDVALDKILPGAVDPRASGQIDGKFEITGTDAKGTIEITGVSIPAGDVAVDMTVVPAPDNDIGIVAQAKLDGVGTVNLGARAQIPDRPLSPPAWKALGRQMLRSFSAQVEQIDVTPEMFAKFGIELPYRGRGGVQLAVGPGGETSKLTIDATGVTGGALAQPIDVHAEASTTPTGTGALLTASAKMKEVLRLDVGVPVTTDQWLAGKWAGNKQAALKGRLEIPSSSAVDLLAVVGRTHLTGGTLEGSADIAGTLATPTLDAKLGAHDIAVAASLGDKAPPVLKDLAVVASWDGTTGKADISGIEVGGGRLHVQGQAAPSNLATGSVRMDIGKLDLVPIAAFLPGALVSLAGQVDAAITIKGFDAASVKLGGNLAITKGRIPISPTIGTLQNTTVLLNLYDRDVGVTLDADLGVNHDPVRNIHIEGTGDMSAIKFTGLLHQVQLANSIQPFIDANVEGDLKHTDRWTGNITIRQAKIFVPQKKGNKLLSSSTPDDLIFVDKPTPLPKTFIRPPPEHPSIDIAVTLRSTSLEVENIAKTNVSGQLQVKLGGGGIGLDGTVDARGTTYLFDRAYDIDHGSVTFDGTMDGLINVRIVHDFPDLSLVAEVGGRVSDPQIELSSVPSQYTQGQLLGFLLGGEPGGDPNSQTQDVASGAGSSIASTLLGSKVKQVVKFIDVLRCDAQSSGQSCTVGIWLIPGKLFGSYKQHLDARPDENRYEGEFLYYLKRSIVLDAIGGNLIESLDLLWRKRW